MRPSVVVLKDFRTTDQRRSSKTAQRWIFSVGAIQFISNLTSQGDNARNNREVGQESNLNFSKDSGDQVVSQIFGQRIDSDRFGTLALDAGVRLISG